jgi:hypothetical protein
VLWSLTRARRSLFACLLSLFIPQNAALAAPSARLVYLRNPGAESCPDETAIRSAVSARLGYDPFLAFARATMIAEISRERNAYGARIKLVDDQNVVRGTRELVYDGKECADIIDMMALSMSIAIDPHSLLAPSKPDADEAKAESSPEAEPESSPPENVPEPPKTPTTPPKAPPPAPATARAHLEVGLGAALWTGAAPDANLSGTAFARLRYARLSLGLEGRADIPASREVSSATLETSLVLGSFVPCVHWAWSDEASGVLAFCGVGSMGVLRGASRNVTAPAEDTALHVAVGPRVAIEFPVAAMFSLWARVDGLFALTPQVLQINKVDVYELSRFSFGASVGGLARFF